ncbi:MAG: GatB/YqeY domain-containing protein [Candidatus Gracilibacteria bacterium]
MSLQEQLQQDLVTAMKAQDKVKTSVLRMLKAAIMKFEVSGKEKLVATEEDVVRLLKKEISQRQDSIEQFKAGNRMDLAANEEAELAILKSYMPEMMSEEALEKIVKETVAEMGVTDPKMMGKVMGAVMAKVKGQADGVRVKTVVQKVLGGK